MKSFIEANLFFRSLKIWFLTISGGLLLHGLRFLIERFESLSEIRFQAFDFEIVGFIYLLSAPVILFTMIILSLSALAKTRRTKAYLLFGLTILVNIFVNVLVAIIFGGGNFRFGSFLAPFSLSSFIIVFIVNRDWFIKLVNERN